MGNAIVTTARMASSQAKIIADRLIPYFRKAGVDLPKDAVQAVLDKEMEPMLEEMFAVFRRRVDVKLALAPRDTFTVSFSQRHNPSSYYVDRRGSRERPGLSMFICFESLVEDAKPTEIGTTFRVSSLDVMHPLNDKEIEGELDDYLFEDDQVCAVIAHLISCEPHRLLLNPSNNLFFTRSCVISLSWSCTSHLWHISARSGRDDRRKVIGIDRVFCLKHKY